MILSNLGKIGDNERQKPKIYLKGGCKVNAGCGSVCLTFGVSIGCRWCRLSGLSTPFVPCSVPSSLPFVAFLLCLWCVACKYAFICDFKGVFRGFWGADVCLYGLRSLRALRGFLCACGVRRIRGLWRVCLYVVLSFAFRFLLLSSCHALLLGFLPCLLSCSLSCFLGFVGWLLVLVGLLFLFPLRTIRKKKGRSVLVRPLLSCCRVAVIWLLPYIPRIRQVSAR